MWFEWWVWGAAAIVLAIGEVLLPSFVLLLTFAVMSLIAWLALRRILGVRQGQVKTFDSDINDN